MGQSRGPDVDQRWAEDLENLETETIESDNCSFVEESPIDDSSDSDEESAALTHADGVTELLTLKPKAESYK